MASKRGIFDTTVMQKFVVALSGLAIVGFLVAHLAGNLLLYAGASAFNKYAQGLRDLGALLWIMRGGVLLAFVLHIVFSVRLKGRNSEARPAGYAVSASQASTMASRNMIYSGLSILAFLLFHLAHFTWGKIQPDKFQDTFMLVDGRMTHNAYTMAIAGFQVAWISVLYVVAVTIVFAHLQHAVQSAVQTLGFNHPRYRPMVLRASAIISTVLWLGFCSIPLSVMSHLVQ